MATRTPLGTQKAERGAQPFLHAALVQHMGHGAVRVGRGPRRARRKIRRIGDDQIGRLDQAFGLPRGAVEQIGLDHAGAPFQLVERDIFPGQRRGGRVLFQQRDLRFGIPQR